MPERAHVFISYQHEDFDFVENLTNRLERLDFDVWEDSRIRAGEEWQSAIDTAIRSAYALIVVMTPKAKASEYVTYEWVFAWGIGIKVIPILLKPTQLHPRLESLQHLDFTDIRARPWERLLDEIKQITVPISSHDTSIIDSNDATSKMKRDLRDTSLTIDSRPLEGRNGHIWQVPYDRYKIVSDLLDDVYFVLVQSTVSLPAGTFGELWGFRDSISGHIFTDLGRTWARAQGAELDRRKLAQVGIKRGMTLEIVALLTIDSRPLEGRNGHVWQVPYDRYKIVSDLLDDLYFALAENTPELRSNTFGEIWYLRDSISGDIFTDLGRTWARAQGAELDRRELAQVGIRPGMTLEALWY